MTRARLRLTCQAHSEDGSSGGSTPALGIRAEMAQSVEAGRRPSRLRLSLQAQHPHPSPDLPAHDNLGEMLVRVQSAAPTCGGRLMARRVDRSLIAGLKRRWRASGWNLRGPELGILRGSAK